MNSARTRFWDFPAALLLTLVVQTAAQRLVVTSWTPRLGAAALAAFFGTALGLALGWSRFRRLPLALLSLFYTLIPLPFLLAGTLSPGLPWLERMGFLLARIHLAFETLAAGQALEDVILFQFGFLLLFWLIGLFSGYGLTRFASVSGAALPSGAALLLLQFFDPGRDAQLLFMAMYLFLALLLLGRVHYACRRAEWKLWRLFSSDEGRADLNLTLAVSAFLMVAAAWLMPLSQGELPLLRRWWQNLSERWEESTAVENITAGLETDSGLTVYNFYDRAMALGQEAARSDLVLFRIQSTGVGNQERYYWRVRSYDIYTNEGWQTGPVNLRYLSSNSRSLDLPQGRGVNAEFEFHVEAVAVGVLVTPPRPIWVNQAAMLHYFPAGAALEPLFLEARQPLLPGETYLVHAVLMEPTEKQLRTAGEAYPDWVTEHYLQLPDDLPPAIPELARQITAEAPTPYDKAQAITRYLRSHITYVTQVPLPPAGRNTLAWFLFDHKAGFCTYYATAEVVMLRSLGIPARLAVGFAEGEFRFPGWYTVRQSDAHAWPEVYFPGIGWVEFEPTVSQPELTRPSGEPTPTPERGNSLPVTPAPEETQRDSLPERGHLLEGESETESAGFNSLGMLLTFFAAVVLVSSLLAWAYISGTLEKGYNRLRSAFSAPLPILARDWLEQNSLPTPLWLERQAWLAARSPLERAFMTVYRLLRPPPRRPLTPAEAAAALIRRLPQAEEEIRLLTEAYQAAVYGNAAVEAEKVRQAARSLRRKARRARWQAFLRRGALRALQHR